MHMDFRQNNNTSGHGALKTILHFLNPLDHCVHNSG
jgi:hypothetical protein